MRTSSPTHLLTVTVLPFLTDIRDELTYLISATEFSRLSIVLSIVFSLRRAPQSFIDDEDNGGNRFFWAPELSGSTLFTDTSFVTSSLPELISFSARCSRIKRKLALQELF